VMRHGTRGTASLRVAWRTLVATPRAVLARFLGPMAATLLIVTAGAVLTSAFDVSRPGAWRIASVFIVHQFAVVAIVALRLRALGAALTLVDPLGTAPDRAEANPSSPVLSG
jgi:hypothetical protein